MGTTENQNKNRWATTSLAGARVTDTYPALEVNPQGVAHKSDGQRDLTPKQSLYDPDHIEVTQHGSMTGARDVSPPLPFRGPLQHGTGTTVSSTAEQLQRQLESDLKVREAIYADGLDPATFDISRGVSSRVGDSHTRSVSE